MFWHRGTGEVVLTERIGLCWGVAPQYRYVSRRTNDVCCTCRVGGRQPCPDEHPWLQEVRVSVEPGGSPDPAAAVPADVPPGLVSDMAPDSESAVETVDDAGLASFGPLLDRLEELLEAVEGLDVELQARVFELLDGVDAVHRLAITRLAGRLGDALVSVRQADPAVDWLFEAYGVGVEDVEAASIALEQIRPYLQEHGGGVEVLTVQSGVVRVQLTGACSGSSATADTLRHGVEEALRENLPGFVAIDVAPDLPPPPPPPVLLQITTRPT
jgi:Fe-S cluster biogenesis protein NfuA